MSAASSPAPAFGQKSSRAMLKEEIQRHHLSAWRLHIKNVKTRRVRLQSLRTRIFIRAWPRAPPRAPGQERPAGYNGLSPRQDVTHP